MTGVLIMTHSARQPEPSYELINPQERSSIFYREHGSPHSLIRWHYHKEYELHLITHSSGKVFVGDYIGNFYPGNLILTGPNLPHNWMTQGNDDRAYPKRDKVITFSDDLISKAQFVFPEIKELNSLLERSRFGIEFSDNDLIQEVHEKMDLVSNTDGVERLSAFLHIMNVLAKTCGYKLLSSDQYFQVTSEKNQAQVNKAVNYIVKHYQGNLTQAEVADHLAMQPAYFSRFFSKATGRRFVEFVNSLRIARACDLLVRSDQKITAICFQVGFGNIANFNRHFYSLKGMTPSDYRKFVINNQSTIY